MDLSQFNFTNTQKSSYNDSYIEYQSVVSALALFNHSLQIIFGLAGIIGGILDMKVLLHPDFRKPSFTYHKALVLNDFVYSIFGVFVMGVVPLALQPSDYRTFINDLCSTYSNFACLTAEAIILFMTLDRFVAVWLPLYFDFYNLYAVAVTTCILSFVSGLFYLVDFGMEKLVATDKGYMLISTDLGKSTFLGDFNDGVYYMELLVVYVLLFFSLVVVAGLCRPNFAVGDSNAAKKSSLRRQLTILNLSCSIPAVSNCTIYVIRSTLLSGLKIGPAAVSMTYEAAMNDLHKALVKAIMYEFQVITGIMAHCLHFYLYVLLSANFRDKTKVVLCGSSKVFAIAVSQTKNTGGAQSTGLPNVG